MSVKGALLATPSVQPIKKQQLLFSLVVSTWKLAFVGPELKNEWYVVCGMWYVK